MPRIRIGVDVGGTFTHAVAINESSSKLIGQVKTQTTHRDGIGVARGVIRSLKLLLKKCRISSKDISLIAHSTTQATNALLEGDVAPVGVISIGTGLQGRFTRRFACFREINLWNNKRIKVIHRFLDTGKGIDYGKVRDMVQELKALGSGALVIAEAFSTEDSKNEDQISEIAARLGIPCTATSGISGLYGLRARTKTAIINASILPVMLDAAEKTQKAVNALRIKSPIMVVRSDGGVLRLDEVMRRPILTILSGPAAGVGASIFHEKLSDGIFIEVGGTSTDISVVKGGTSQIRPAFVGPHRIHMKTLDIKTLGVAGGSLPRIRKGALIDVGPRSAHIAGLGYASFSILRSPKKLRMKYVSPKESDPSDYMSFSQGRLAYALTPTCAANYLGIVKPGDFAYGDRRSIKNVFMCAQAAIGIDGGKLARRILDISSGKLEKAVKSFMRGYGLDPHKVKLIGGGGGAAALVPYLAGRMGLRYKLTKDHAVISAIGAALSMVHEEVERSIPYPAEKDIMRVRDEAKNKVISMGALPSSVSVDVTVDKQRNIVRASAFGSLKMEKKKARKMSVRSLRLKIIKEETRNSPSVRFLARTGRHSLFQVNLLVKRLFIKSKAKWMYILDNEGSIRKRLKDAKIKLCNGRDLDAGLREVVNSSRKYGDAGAILPKIMLVFPNKLIDLSGASDEGLMKALAGQDAGDLRPNDKVAIIWKLE